MKKDILNNKTIFSRDLLTDRFKKNRLRIYSIIVIFNLIIIFLLFTLGKDIFSLRIAKNNLDKQQKFNISIALNLNYLIQNYHKFIIHSANNFDYKKKNDPVYADQFIHNYSYLVNIFNNGIYLFDSEGVLLEEFPKYANRKGMNYNHRQYYKETIATGKPVVSDPYISSQIHSHPCIMFTSPIYDNYGKIIAIFGGSIDLARNNFLVQPLNNRFSEYSYFTLYKNDGTIVFHPDSKYILSKISKVNLLNQKELTDFNDIRIIRDVQYIPYTKWFISLNVLKNEILKNDHKQYLLIVFIILCFILLTDVFLVIIFINTIFQYDKFLDDFVNYDFKNLQQPLIKETGNAHIRFLAGKMNELLSAYRENQYHVRSLKQDIMNLFSLAPFAFLLIDRVSKKIIYANSDFLKLTEYKEEDLPEKTANELLYQDFDLYIKPFFDFLKCLDDTPQTRQFIIFNKHKKQIQIKLTGYHLKISDRERYALIFENVDEISNLKTDFEIFSFMFKFLMFHSNSYIQITDSMGKIKDCSTSFYEHFGDKEHFTGKSLWECIPNEHERMELQRFYHELRTNQDPEFNLVFNIENIREQKTEKIKLEYQLVRDNIGKTHFVIALCKIIN